MTLSTSLIDALYALYLTEPALVAGGLFGALVIACALLRAAGLTLAVTR